MPTIFSHAIFASSVGSAFRLEHDRARFWILTAICAMLPDADVISFAFGVSYGSMFGHRGITHSIIFAVTIGILVSVLFYPGREIPKWKLALYFGLVTATHPFLDMFTNGGRGVALLAPFSGERFFFPWRPIEVSPIGLDFFSDRGFGVIASEIIWIWVPSAIIFVVASLVRRRS
ncbi:MAG: hydrolase [Acidobacteria bacterium]|nr:MAG: hydrolase [Acidobacteriota bacterium]